MFSGLAYNNGPAAYLFINGGGGFNGAASTGDTGNIFFGGGGATDVSFHAADLANGPATIFTSFDIDGAVLESFETQVDNLNGNAGDAGEILNFAAVGGQNIFRIEANLPGPVANPSLRCVNRYFFSDHCCCSRAVFTCFVGVSGYLWSATSPTLVVVEMLAS